MRELEIEEFCKLLGYDDANHINSKISYEGGMDYWLNEYETFSSIDSDTDVGSALDEYFKARSNLLSMFTKIGITGDDDEEHYEYDKDMEKD